MSKVEKWTVHNSKTIAHTRIFSLNEMECSSNIQAGKRSKFVYLDSPDWVNVIAITPEKKVVLVKQYRHGRREITLEIPGGLCDEEEDVIQAGLRELQEETGFTGSSAEIIGVVEPNPAFLNNQCSTIVVYQARETEIQNLDDTEEIEVVLLSLEEVEKYIQSGIIKNAMIIAAFYFFAQFIRKKESKSLLHYSV